MRHLPQIRAAYDLFLAHWRAATAQAATEKNDALIIRLNGQRDVLERGMFVLMFGQFESAMNAAFETARAERLGNPDWTRRRGWDAQALQGERVSFETKLSMVVDERSAHYAAILTTYAIRNTCAHGGMTAAVGSIDSLEAELYVWAAQLRT